LKKIGSFIGSVACFTLGTKVMKKQVKYLNDDMNHFKEDFKSIKLNNKTGNRHVDEWDSFILTHNISTKKLKTQYKIKRRMSFLLLFIMFLSLCFILIASEYKAGLAGLLISGLFYFVGVFRLYQVRHKTLCKIRVFLHDVKGTLKEVLPLNLPEDWSAINNSEEYNEVLQ